MTTWHKFIAVGDSFTEGLEDRIDQSRHRGWADRVAAIMSQETPDFTYANLAIRGRKLDDIVGNQLPTALEMQPDLVSIAGGVNDLLRPRWDATTASATLESGVIAARESGSDVLLFAFGNLSRRSRVMGTVTARLSEYRDLTLAVAEAHGCYVVDFWPETVFDDPRFWADDRLHLNDLGHERVAMIVASVLGLRDDDWREPLAAPPSTNLLDAVRADLNWTGRHLVPWLARRVRSRSSGDDVAAKRPTLTAVDF